MPPLLRVLIADDNDDDAVLMVQCIRKGGYQVEHRRVDTADAMELAIGEPAWDIIISDVNIPGFGAKAALELYKRSGVDLPFIVVSGVVGEEAAVSLLKSGAHDFILKTNLARLVPAIERAFGDWEVRRARREAEEALRQSEERYTLAAAGSNDGLWDWDLIDGRVYYSERWKAMLGHAEADIGDSPADWLERVHPDDLTALRECLDAHLAGRAPHFSAEHRLRDRDGEWRWMLVRGLAVRRDDGTPCRIAGSLTDITGSKLAEQALREAKDDLENALTAKTRFLAAASHDLRQPVQALLCFAAVLESELRGHPSERVIGELQASLSGLTCLLESLLDVSKLDAGIVQPNLETIQLAPFLEQLAAEMRPSAEQKGLELRVRSLDAAVRSDPVLLGRILRNLVENAIRYTESGGILLGCRRRDGRIAIGVWDTGIGIADEQRRQIFEEFYQVGNTERDRRKGLGLGLAIVERLSRLLDHSVDVRSRLGRGSSFTITADLVEATPEPSAALEHIECKSGTVLVIDDDFLVAKATATLMQAWGFEAVAATSIRQALAALPDPPSCLPCLILADYRLREGETGLDAIERICRHCQRDIPSIIITGDTAPERLREVERSGLTMLHKPVDPNQLRNALAAVMRCRAKATPLPP